MFVTKLRNFLHSHNRLEFYSKVKPKEVIRIVQKYAKSQSIRCRHTKKRGLSRVSPLIINQELRFLNSSNPFFKNS